MLATPLRRAALVFLLVLLAVAFLIYLFLTRDEPERFSGIVDHYKYGSIGSEADGGIPYWVWRVLPDVFPDLVAEHVPGGEGDGYRPFGFIYEDRDDLAFERPIGTSVREAPIPLLALNCAACHTGTIRESADAEPLLVLGMPAQQLDFLAYERFLTDVVRDPRFDGDTLVAAIRRVNPDFTTLEEVFFRWIVIPRMRDELLQLREDFSFIDDGRPDWGPGRVDTFTPYKVRFDFPGDAFEIVGTADFPSLWNQGVREGMNLHWDGNNSSLNERNYSAAIGAGASESSIEIESIARVKEWIADLQPPPFPGPIDAALAEQGAELFRQSCAACHALDGARIGQATDILTLGTDDARLRSYDAEIAAKMNTLGEGRPWALSNFRSSDGYANAPLDGIWLRAPYLHNGSVPTLRDLLRPPDERPAVFYRGYDVYDFADLGFISVGPEAEAAGVRFDTADRGNGNGGHVYGTSLTSAQIDALLEYLKTQ